MSVALEMKLNRFKKDFFRAELIEKLADKSLAAGLADLGAHTQRIAMRSLRRSTAKKQSTRDKPSKPGTPPKHRAKGDGGLRKIFFAYAGDGEVVIGPMLFNMKQQPPATQLQEYGGQARVFMTRRKDKAGQDNAWEFASKRQIKKRAQDPSRDYEWRHLQYPARPFMRPALAKALSRKNIRQAFHARLAA